MTKIYLGAWKHPRPGWVNVDLYPQDETTIKDDARTLKTFRKASVDLILAVHLIEHISHKDIQGMFRHWQRVLKPGGEAVVECPDLFTIAKAYLKWHEQGCQWTEELATKLVHRPLNVLSPRSWQTLFGGTHEHRGHWNGSYWDAPRLKMEMEQAKFSQVRVEPAKESLITWGPSIRVVGVR